MTEQDTGRSQRAEAQPPKAALSAEQKKMLQAKHRVEEAEARNRKKERNARTRRLIQEGAILERVFPQAQNMGPEALKAVLEQRLGAKETNNGD
jgi:hypothetical protein